MRAGLSESTAVAESMCGTCHQVHQAHSANGQQLCHDLGLFFFGPGWGPWPN